MPARPRFRRRPGWWGFSLATARKQSTPFYWMNCGYLLIPEESGSLKYTRAALSRGGWRGGPRGRFLPAGCEAVAEPRSEAEYHPDTTGSRPHPAYHVELRGVCPFRSQNRAGSANPQRVEGREGCVGRLSFARSLRSNDKSIEDSNIFLKCSSFSLPLHIPLSLDGMAILSLTVLPALPVKLSRRHCSLPSFEGAFLTRQGTFVASFFGVLSRKPQSTIIQTLSPEISRISGLE